MTEELINLLEPVVVGLLTGIEQELLLLSIIEKKMRQ